MFITGGRAGQVMYFAMLVIIVFQYFPGKVFKASFISLIVLLSTFSTAYLTSEIFKHRVDLATSEFINYKRFLTTTPNSNETFVISSVGERMVYAISSWEIFKEHPIIGAGTGDFKNEFANKLSINAPYVQIVENPHNMYSLILAQFGLIGLAALLYMFYTQVKIARQSNEEFVRKIGVALPLLYLLIMLSDSYLMVHMTGLLFIFISSFVYKDYEADKQYHLKTTR
jgi:O-antigen ligase